MATFKSHLSKSITSESPSQEELARAVCEVLFAYRSMPRPELDGSCPSAEVLHGRRPKNFLSLLLCSPVKEHSRAEVLRFPPGSAVFCRNYGKGPRWLPGVVTLAKGAVMRIIKGDRVTVKRHCNQLQVRLLDPGDSSTVNPERSALSERDRAVESGHVLPRRNVPRTRYPPQRYRFES